MRYAVIDREAAHTRASSGRAPEKLLLHLSDLDKTEQQFGKRSHNVAVANKRCARFLLEADPAKAMPFLTTARSIYEELGMGATAECANVIACTATAYTSIGKLKDALTCYERALTMYRELSPGDSHPALPDVLYNVVALQRALEEQVPSAITPADSVAADRRSHASCAAVGCPRNVKADRGPLERCAGCLCTFYCSKACQTADWKAG